MSADRRRADAASAAASCQSPRCEPGLDGPHRDSVAIGNGSSPPTEVGRSGLPRRLLPQSRPTPTPREAAAVIRFLQARLRDNGCPAGCLAARVLAAEGILTRYRRSVTYAAHPPRGLEQAWELAAATLASEVADLAAAWSNHPDFDPNWIR